MLDIFPTKVPNLDIPLLGILASPTSAGASAGSPWSWGLKGLKNHHGNLRGAPSKFHEIRILFNKKGPYKIPSCKKMRFHDGTISSNINGKGPPKILPEWRWRHWRHGLWLTWPKSSVDDYLESTFPGWDFSYLLVYRMGTFTKSTISAACFTHEASSEFSFVPVTILNKSWVCLFGTKRRWKSLNRHGSVDIKKANLEIYVQLFFHVSTNDLRFQLRLLVASACRLVIIRTCVLGINYYKLALSASASATSNFIWGSFKRKRKRPVAWLGFRYPSRIRWLFLSWKSERNGRREPFLNDFIPW